MPASKAQQRAVNKYVKDKYDRILLTMPKGQKEIIQAHAEAQGESVNGFINRAIDEASEWDDVYLKIADVLAGLMSEILSRIESGNGNIGHLKDQAHSLFYASRRIYSKTVNQICNKRGADCEELDHVVNMLKSTMEKYDLVVMEGKSWVK